MKPFILALALGATTVAAAPAIAQGAGPAAQQTTRSSRTAPPAAPAEPDPAPVRAATDAHLAAMRGRLRITPAQQAQWDVFATVSRENADEMHARFERRRAGLARFDAAQNMADFAQISELHARQLARLSAAFQSLYTTMPAEQQREADAYFREIRNPEAPARPRPNRTQR